MKQNKKRNLELKFSDKLKFVFSYDILYYITNILKTTKVVNIIKQKRNLSLLDEDSYFNNNILVMKPIISSYKDYEISITIDAIDPVFFNVCAHAFGKENVVLFRFPASLFDNYRKFSENFEAYVRNYAEKRSSETVKWFIRMCRYSKKELWEKKYLFLELKESLKLK